MTATDCEVVAEWAAARPVLQALVNVPPAAGRKPVADEAENLTPDWQLLVTLLASNAPLTWSANQVARLEDLLDVMADVLTEDLAPEDLSVLAQLERWAAVRCRALSAGQAYRVQPRSNEPVLV